MDTIFLNGVVIHAYHGCLPQEQTLGQRFILQLELDLDLRPASRSDDLAQSVSYAEVHAIAQSIATTRRFNLIEALAEAIAEALFQHSPLIHALRITVEKPSAPIAGIFESVGVTLRRQRDS